MSENNTQQPTTSSVEDSTPVPFALHPLILSNPATSQKLTATKVDFEGGSIRGELKKGDLFVLGLKRKDAPPPAPAAGTKEASDKDKGKTKGHTYDFAQVGGSYVFVVEPFDAETHDMARVIGAVFRRIDEDKMFFQLIPESMSRTKLYFHSHPVAKPKYAHFQRLHDMVSKPKDENGLIPDNEGWAVIPEGCAFNISPYINNVRDGGSDLKLEITFKSSHHHDLAEARDFVKKIFTKHDDTSAKAPQQKGKESTGCSGCSKTDCQAGNTTNLNVSEEVVSVGIHVVTGA